MTLGHTKDGLYQLVATRICAYINHVVAYALSGKNFRINRPVQLIISRLFCHLVIFSQFIITYHMSVCCTVVLCLHSIVWLETFGMVITLIYWVHDSM